MFAEEKILVGCNENTGVFLLPKMANRHGLIAGATGTGKTVTLKVLAESFSDLGVPVFLADMKGDVSGLAKVGSGNDFITKNREKYGLDLNLSEAQAGVLNIIFRVADEHSLPIIDLKDLKSMINYVVENKDQFESQYGAIAEKSANTILRSLIALEDQGGNDFFGEPALELNDFMQLDDNGCGVINVLDAQKLSLSPEIYSTFLLWMLCELFEKLPEVGDMEKPKLVFFFDEAHLLFDDMSPEFGKKIEQVVRLIRSKGVGIYFISQSPADIPDDILAQLGNRIQHALRAYTPKDQKAVKTAADTFRANPEFKTDEAITNLETGEALVSFLDEKGAPNIVERAKILFPLSQIGAIDDGQRSLIMRQSRIAGKYDTPIDRESAFEVLLAQAEAERKAAEQAQAEAEKAKAEEAEAKAKEKEGKGKKSLWSRIWKAIVTAVTATIATIIGTKISDTVTGKKSRKSSTSATGRVVKNATSAATRTITRDILGNILK